MKTNIGLLCPLQIAMFLALGSLYIAGCGNSAGMLRESAQRGNKALTIAEQVEPFINQLVKEDRFSGVVLVAKDGAPIFEKAYGLASKEFNVPNNLDTRFNIASLTKMFTAVSIAQLAERGKLKYEDRIIKFLPDYPSAVANKVTIHHLLTHTSGMGSYWKDEFHEANHARFRKIQDYFPLFVHDPLDFEPGQKWSYSNAGYMILGAIIERVTGKSYFDYVKENVFSRAGMDRTDFFEADRPMPDIAQAYTKRNRYLPEAQEWTNSIFLSPVKGSPAGGAYSTTKDLLKFGEAIRNHKLLYEASTIKVLTGIVEYKPNHRYGYGFATETLGNHTIVFHDGGANGASAQFEMYPDYGFTVVVLSNYDHPAVVPIIEKLRQIFLVS